MSETTPRAPKNAEGSAVSNGALGFFVTKIMLAFAPDLDPETIGYTIVGAMSAWPWIGSKLRDAVDEYKKDGGTLNWFGRWTLSLFA